MESPNTNGNTPEAGAEKSGAGSRAGGGAFLVGVVLFAITKNPVWLAIGVAFGAAAGTAVGTISQGRRKDNIDS